MNELDGNVDAGYLGTFDVEAEESLAELRQVFWRKAHTDAMERAVTELLRQTPMDVDRIGQLLLRDLPEGKAKVALLRSRFAIGLSNCPNSRVLVDEEGKPVARKSDCWLRATATASRPHPLTPTNDQPN